MPALGIGAAVGAVAFYLAYLFLQRTPLDPGLRAAEIPARRLTRGAAD